MPKLSLSLLGSFQAVLDDVPVTVFESSKVRALLAYLAIEIDQPHSRDTLAALLWPLRPNSNALSNVRYALYNLRNALKDRTADPPFLLVTHHTVQFNAASSHCLDVTEFHSLVGIAGALAGLDDKEQGPINDKLCPTLESAIALYKGPFLNGFSVSGSPGFEEWALLKREQLNREMVSALQRLVVAYQERQAYAAATRCLRRQLELEPWDERGHRSLMRLLAVTDGRAAALRQYEACCRLLERDLGVEPTARTRRLYESIRKGRAGISAPRIQPPRRLVSPPPAATPPIVGRANELSKLERLLDVALSGHGRVAFVVGEAGSGKTTLMHAFTHRAMEAHPNLVTASGSCCHHGSSGDACLPFREILQSLSGDVEPRQAAGSLSREEADRLWRLFPHIAQTIVNEAPALIDRFVPGTALLERAEAFWPSGAAWQRRLRALVKRTEDDTRFDVSHPYDLFQQVTNALRIISDYQPLVLLIDDLQFADPASVSLLFHIGRHLAGSRILILGAHRPVPSPQRVGEQRHALPSVLHELQRLFGDIRVDLDQANGRAFTQALLDTEVNCLGDAFREGLERHTGGNPLFTVELLRGLQGRGDLVQDASGRWIVGPSLDWTELPSRVEAVIAERLDELPGRAREVLQVASVEGQTFTAQVVAQALGSPLSVVQDLLAGPLGREHQLVQPHSLVRVRPEPSSSSPSTRTLSRYRFRHGLFQTYLYGSLNEIERPSLHESVAAALESCYQQAGGDMVTSSARLAWHFEAAGLIDKATEYLLRAGTEAMELSANEEAIQCFGHALDLLEGLPPSPERAERELELQIALEAPLLATEG